MGVVSHACHALCVRAAMDWPEADAPARAEATPEHGSRPHESGKNLDVAPSVRRRLKVSVVMIDVALSNCIQCVDGGYVRGALQDDKVSEH